MREYCRNNEEELFCSLVVLLVLEEDIRDMSLLALAMLLGSRVTGVLMFIELAKGYGRYESSQVKSSQSKGYAMRGTEMKRNVTGDVPSNGLPAKLNASKQELLSILLSSYDIASSDRTYRPPAVTNCGWGCACGVCMEKHISIYST